MLRKIFIGYALLGLLAACGEVRPLWKGTSELKNHTVYFSEPSEYLMDLTHLEQEIEASLELTVTYYAGTSHTTLPLILIFEDSSHVIREYTTNIRLKEGGEWLGFPSEDGTSYTLSEVAIPEIALKPETYVLRIYANDEEAEKVEGILSLTARVFEVEVEE
ncbi:MAG: hypothetical protein OHK0039_27570 [Bacteroidia bacterium]